MLTQRHFRIAEALRLLYCSHSSLFQNAVIVAQGYNKHGISVHIYIHKDAYETNKWLLLSLGENWNNWGQDGKEGDFSLCIFLYL